MTEIKFYVIAKAIIMYHVSGPGVHGEEDAVQVWTLLFFATMFVVVGLLDIAMCPMFVSIDHNLQDPSLCQDPLIPMT